MVLFASYSGAWGGAERLLLDWAPALDSQACLACPPGGLAEAAEEAGLRVFLLRPRSLRLRGRASVRVRAGVALAHHARELHELAAGLDPELFVAWGMRSALAWCLGRRPHGPWAFHHNDFLPAGGASRLVRLAARRADLVTASSRAVADDLGPDGRLGERLLVVHPGVDGSRFTPAHGPVRAPVVLVLGSLVAWKRPDLALEACARVRRSHPQLQVRLAGGPIDEDGEHLLERLRQRAGAPDLAGAVEFLGAVPRPEAELAQATCLLHCAEREPFGLAVLEALAAGRPVVVPDTGGVREIVDSSCGILYRPGDAAGAAEGIGRLLRDPDLAQSLGEAGRRRAVLEFDAAQARARWAQAARSIRDADAMRRRPARTARSDVDPATISVVTVTHNSEPFLESLLRSIQRHIPQASVIVVDCASRDGTVGVARHGRGTQVIELERNIGFGRGCNLGLASVGTPVTVLVNPDVELLDDSLLDLAATALASGGERRLLAPLLVGADGRREDSVHPLPGSGAELLSAAIPGTLLPRALSLGVAPWRSPCPRRVGWAVGAALLARSETFRRLGPFDEQIFLYGEDLDLGFRAAAQGIETWFCPQSRLLHHRAHASRREFGGEAFAMLAGARRNAVASNLGRRGLLLDDLSQGLTFALRATARRALGRDAERERRQLQALLAARRGAPARPVNTPGS